MDPRFAPFPTRDRAHEMMRRLEDMERRFQNMERHGKITDVKYDKKRKRWYAKFEEGEGDDAFKSNWLPWKSFSHGAISVSLPPRKGMVATMKSPRGDTEMAHVEQGHYGPDTTSPHDKQDEAVIQFQMPKEKKDDAGSGSNGSASSRAAADDKDDAPMLRIHAKHDGMVLTMGKIGTSEDARNSNGDGADDDKGNKTFQMSVSRDGKTITCGKFKAVLGKDGAKVTWGDKVGFELKDGQIEQFVDGAKQTLTKDNIVNQLGNAKQTMEKDKLTTLVGGVTQILDTSKFQINGGDIKHDDRNIGKNHTHSGVMAGPAKTQQPDP